jgi:phosphoribosyl-AMP cyclohydrolase
VQLKEATVNGPDFSKNELIPVVAQDATSGTVLMLAYMNAEAYRETLESGRVCYWSRSRRKLWRKGEESGTVQRMKQVFYDCDADTLLVKVEQVGGAACHEGYESCFFREVDPGRGETQVVGERVFDPAEVYQR